MQSTRRVTVKERKEERTESLKISGPRNCESSGWERPLQMAEVIYKCPSQRKTALLILGSASILLSLAPPHPTHKQILLTELSESTSNLTVLASSASGSNHHLSPGVSWLVSWLLLWYYSLFPHRNQNDLPLKKPMGSCSHLPVTSIILRKRSKIFIMACKNLLHLVMAPTWPDHPLLSSSFTTFQPLICSCCCFNP